MSDPFDPGCRRCPRLAGLLDGIRRSHAGYHAAPVAAFGDEEPRLLIVGLAPGMHGANRSGRPFTGDYAGILLYRTLYELGMATHPESESADDGLRLKGVRITNAVKCLPPQNKPTGAEIRCCNPYLQAEIEALPAACNLLALGKIAHDAVVMAYGERLAAHKFAHGAEHRLPDGRRLTDSYHCSRYNTQTRRLTPAMFHAVMTQATEG